MFIQVIQGTIADADLLRRQTERWERELEPGAPGFLGSTSGVTPDGRAITLARFESEADARANSARPEQAAWWNETEKAFGGTVTFHDCRQVDALLGGGSKTSVTRPLPDHRQIDESKEQGCFARHRSPPTSQAG